MFGLDPLSSRPLSALADRSLSKVLSASIAAGARRARAITRSLPASVALVSQIPRHVTRVLQFSAIGASAVTRTVGKAFYAAAAAGVRRARVVGLVRSVDALVGSHRRRAVHLFRALAAAVSSEIIRSRGVVMRASVSAAISVSTGITRAIRLLVSELADVVRFFVLNGTLRTLDPEVFHVLPQQSSFLVTSQSNVFLVAAPDGFGVYAGNELQGSGPRQRT